MSKKTKKKKIVWQQYIAVVFFMLIGAACGMLMVKYIDTAAEADLPMGEQLAALFILFLLMYVAIFVQIIIHEAGHLVFGLLSGYRFSSFRIMSFMWVKDNGKIRFRRLSLAGTGGQCLMAPPDIVDGKLPVVLYNLGGSLLNIIAGLISLGLYLMLEKNLYLSVTLLMMAVIGFAFAIMNGVPMRMGTVDNDGYNAFALSRSPEALRAFWIQMKVSDQTARGVRLGEMPEEWFAVPSDEAMKNSMVVALGVFACNRLMDRKEFPEADRLMEHLLSIDSGMVGLYRNLMICDRIYCGLIAGRQEVLAEMFTKEQKKFMKSMKNFPSVLRTRYTCALLGEQNAAEAKKAQAQFEKMAASYPYPNDIQSERELMEIAAAMAEK